MAKKPQKQAKEQKTASQDKPGEVQFDEDVPNYPPKKVKKLEPKQKRFCEEYIIDFNATQAALRAGYGGTKKDPKVAAVQACRLLIKDNVCGHLAEITGKQSKRLEVTADNVLNEIRRVAFCDVGQAFNDDGTLKPIHEIPEDVRRAISGFEVEEIWKGRGEDRTQTGELKKLKFWNKDSNNEMLMKHLGQFKQDNDQKNEAVNRLLDIIDGNSKGKLPSENERTG
jgi:phage terminase small subunit